jgi:hypothetical protein
VFHVPSYFDLHEPRDVYLNRARTRAATRRKEMKNHLLRTLEASNQPDQRVLGTLVGRVLNKQISDQLLLLFCSYPKLSSNFKTAASLLLWAIVDRLDPCRRLFWGRNEVPRFVPQRNKDVATTLEVGYTTLSRRPGWHSFHSRAVAYAAERRGGAPSR